MEKLENINWGIIGCGSVTELKSGPAFSKVPHSRLVSVMRRNEALVRDYAERHHVPNYTTDANELINDPAVNAVYVATPPSSHAQYAIAAMRAGKPVYVEKPMATTHAECLEMIRVSEETGMPIYVAYYRRSLPLFLKVKELIDSETIGKVIAANLRFFKAFGLRDQFPEKQTWHVKPEISGGGIFYDLASHQFDYLDFLFGPISECKGFVRNVAGYYQPEDSLAASFRFKSGVIGTGSWSYVTDLNNDEDLIEIIGTQGSIRFSCFGNQTVEIISSKGKKILEFTHPENISHFLVEQVVNALRGETQCVSTAYSASRTNWVLEQITSNECSDSPNDFA